MGAEFRAGLDRQALGLQSGASRAVEDAFRAIVAGTAQDAGVAGAVAGIPASSDGLCGSDGRDHLEVCGRVVRADERLACSVHARRDAACVLSFALGLLRRSDHGNVGACGLCLLAVAWRLALGLGYGAALGHRSDGEAECVFPADAVCGACRLAWHEPGAFDGRSEPSAAEDSAGAGLHGAARAAAAARGLAVALVRDL